MTNFFLKKMKINKKGRKIGFFIKYRLEKLEVPVGCREE